MSADFPLHAQSQPIIAGVPPVPVLRLSVEQYHQMGRAGILAPASRVELLEGWLVPQMMKNPAHRIATEAVRCQLERLLPAGWHVNSQEPITLSASEPEPDVTVLRGDLRDYPDRHPGPGDVAIVVEVADTSLHADRDLKHRIYARDGIPVYWIVNLPDRRVEVCADPAASADPPVYRRRNEYAPGEHVPVIVAGSVIGAVAVAELLP